MTEVRILNKNFDPVPPDAVYVGRGSPYGNPFLMGRNGNRGQVIELFREWVLSKPDMVELIRRNLRGKDLVCFCAPAYCHAEVLSEIANAPD